MSAYGLAALNIGGELLGSLFGGGMNYHYQSKLMDKQFQLQNQMLDKVNAYNSPEQQVARLRSAGLNPNLAYQGVNSVAGSSTPSVAGGSASMPAPRLKIAESMMMAEQVRTQKAEADLREAQAYGQQLANIKEESEQPYWSDNALFRSKMLGYLRDVKGFEAKNAELDNFLNNIVFNAKIGNDDYLMGRDGTQLEGIGVRVSDSPLGKSVVEGLASKGLNNNEIERRIQFYDDRASEIIAHIELMKKQGKNLDMRTELLQLEKTMKESLGVGYGDALGWRLLARFLGTLGVSPESLVEYLK